MDPQIENIVNILSDPRYLVLFLALTVWIIAWKGVALWKAARNNQRNWFVAILVINSLGILEIIYIFYFSKPKDNKPVV